MRLARLLLALTVLLVLVTVTTAQERGGQRGGVPAPPLMMSTNASRGGTLNVSGGLFLYLYLEYQGQ